MPEDIGDFTQDEIAAVAQAVGLPEGAGTGPVERFVKQVSELVSVRLAAGEAEGITVFLNSDAIDSDAEGRGWLRVPFLRSGNDPVSCRILLSNVALGAAYVVDQDTPSADEIEAIRKAGLGGLPAVVVDWRGETPRAMLYGSGVDDLGDVVDVQLFEEKISVEEMKAALDDFYDRRLRTPYLVTQGSSSRIWNDPKKGWPVESPERAIQGVLMTHLLGRWPRLFVRAEVINEDGRLDLEVFAKLKDAAGENVVKILWILELKALADRGSTGSKIYDAAIIAAINKGLGQALAYREAQHGNQIALCCFDMRANDVEDAEVFKEIAKEANDNDVRLWRWYLYRSTEDAREAKRAAKKAAKAAAG
jgi:hypothetical protein